MPQKTKSSPAASPLQWNSQPTWFDNTISCDYGKDRENEAQLHRRVSVMVARLRAVVERAGGGRRRGADPERKAAARRRRRLHHGQQRQGSQGRLAKDVLCQAVPREGTGRLLEGSSDPARRRFRQIAA